MTDENDEEFDVGALAALARPSLAPAPAPEDEEDEEEDAKVDLRALTTSIPPEAHEDDDDEDDDEPVAAAATAAAEPKKDSGAQKKSPKKNSSGAVAGTGATEAKPVPVPAQAEPSGGGTMVKGVVLVAILGVGAWVAFGQRGDEPETHAANQPRTEQRTEVETALTGTRPSAQTEIVAQAQTETESETETESDETETETETEAVGSVAVDNPTRMRRVRGSSSAETSTATMENVAVAMVAEPTMEASMEEATMDSADMSSVEDLLSRALGMDAEPTMAAVMETAMDENLPDVPSQSAVTRALGGLMSRMRQCAGEQEGLATARIRVRSDGQVASVNIGGRPFGGTPQGACMEGVVRTAHFPRFRRTNFDVTYPFSIRQLN